MALIPTQVTRPVDVLVVGSVNMDLVVTLDRAPEGGETVLGRTLATYPGGKGANQAVAAARLGARTALAGRVGADAYGKALLEGLRKDGVDLSHVATVTDAPTGTAVILVEASGENRIVVVPGANGTLLPADLEPARFAEANVVLISQEIPAETVAAALRMGREAGCLTLLNPAPARSIDPELLALVDVLIPNRAEAAALTGRPVESLADARMAATALQEMGVGSVVVTLGVQGALVVRDNLSELVPAHQVAAVDTTAAGDAFCGALATALSLGQPLLAAVSYGVTAAAICVTREGAQPSLPTAQEVEALLRMRR